MNDIDIYRELPPKIKYEFFCLHESGAYIDKVVFRAFNDHDAFQQASKKWFENEEVARHKENDGVITLFSTNGDVIGKLKRA
ncbi:hypothetical protein [Synechococcus sp. PCC 6312]|uniref:hypothetical protein n=1 Tax=Synechococcus sp. (strain ATCC 27167 / PCC 6312) TaxID=195253 RepID=UPI0012EA7770|nr:hypothetical protein [Synechococcus sp. PCC 6312]